MAELTEFNKQCLEKIPPQEMRSICKQVKERIEKIFSGSVNIFEYRLGQEINIKDFNLMYNVECANGFHFFRTREEAENY